MKTLSATFFYPVFVFTPAVNVNILNTNRESKYSDQQCKKIYNLLFPEKSATITESHLQQANTSCTQLIKKQESPSHFVDVISYLYDIIITSNPLYTFFAGSSKAKQEDNLTQQHALVLTERSHKRLYISQACNFDCPEEILDITDYKQNSAFLKITELFKKLKGQITPLSPQYAKKQIDQIFDTFTNKNALRAFKLSLLRRIHPDNAMRYKLNNTSYEYLKELFSFASYYYIQASKV